MTTLYERLGGYDAIASVVDELFARKCADEQLSRFFAGMSTDTKRKIRQNVVNFLCEATGGPCYYTGRDLKTVHTGLNITEGDWEIFVQIAIDTMNKFKVPEQERSEVFAAVSGLKKDIVGL